MRFTEAQLSTLDTSSDITVTAGAGSGKTRVLVERYISSLEDPGSGGPSGVLALTFTEKASNEMKERVRESLTERYLRSPEERYERFLTELDNADISTIHSFCTRIIRMDPSRCGVDPDFHVVTGAEEVTLMKEALGELFSRDNEDTGPLRRLIADRSTAGLGSTLLELYSASARTSMRIEEGDFLELSLRFWESALEEALSNAVDGMEDILDSLRFIIDHPLPRDGSDTLVRVVSGIRKAFSGTISFENGKPDVEGILLEVLGKNLGTFLTAKGKKRSFRQGREKVWGEEVQVMREALDRMALFTEENREFLDFLSRPGSDERGRRRLVDLHKVYGNFKAIYDRKKESVNGLDFNDLVERALFLLKDEGSHVRHELTGRYDHILVDEFQDTDPRQWEIIDLIWNGGKKAKLFLVGDPKQSIYGFRSADVRLFRNAERMMGSMDSSRVVLLDRNFRSRREIMEFVNVLFPGIFVEEKCSWGVDFQPLKAHRSPGASVSFIGVRTKRSKELREGHAVSRLIRRALREGWPGGDEDSPLKAGDIAVLVPARTDLKYYEEAFLNDGIPFQVYKGKGFFSRQEIVDVSRLLDFFSDSGDDVALASVLKGPLFGLSDEDLLRISGYPGETLFQKLESSVGYGDIHLQLKDHLRTASCLPLREAMSRIMDEAGIWATVGGKRERRNLEKLLDLMGEEMGGMDPREASGCMRDMLEYLKMEGESPMDADPDKVSIMTIHAAKGLEWPMVVIMGIHHRGVGSQRGTVKVHPDRGMSLRFLDPQDGEMVSPPSWVETVRELERMEFEENKRLLYVACTRARDHLVLSGSIPEGTGDGKDEAEGLMGLIHGPGRIDPDSAVDGILKMGDVSVSVEIVGDDMLIPDIEEEPSTSEVPVQPPDLRYLAVPEEREFPHFISPAGGTSKNRRETGRKDGSGQRTPSLPREYPFTRGEVPPKVKGTAVHRVLEGIPMERVLKESGYELDPDWVEATVKKLRDQLEADPVLELSEVEYVSIIPEGEGSGYELGRVDRLTLDSEGNWLIQDFKTGRFDPGWKEQIERYTRSLRRLTGRVVKGKVVMAVDKPL